MSVLMYDAGLINILEEECFGALMTQLGITQQSKQAYKPMHKKHPITPMAYTQMAYTSMKTLTHFFLFFALQINTALPLCWRGLVGEDSSYSAYFQLSQPLNIHQLCQDIPLEIAILEMR